MHKAYSLQEAIIKQTSSWLVQQTYNKDVRRCYIQMSLKDPLLSVSLFCHLASIILCALILSETLALYKSFTYFTYLTARRVSSSSQLDRVNGVLRSPLDGAYCNASPLVC